MIDIPVPDPVEICNAEQQRLVFSEDKKTLLKFEEPLIKCDFDAINLFLQKLESQRSDSENEQPSSVNNEGSQSENNFVSYKDHYKIVIPEGVEYIEKEAFRFCHIEEIVFPQSLKGIGDRAFYECSLPENIILPDSVEYIGKMAFAFSTVLQINIPSSVTDLGEGFICKDSYYQDKLKIISNNPRFVLDSSKVLIDTRKKILLEAHTVSGDYTVPAGISRIADFAFYKNPGVTSVSMPDSVKSIGDYAFDRCEELIAAKLPDSIQSIGEMAFESCGKLKNIELPPGIKKLARGVFRKSGLAKIIVPEKVEYIGEYAFESCSELKEVVFKAPANIAYTGKLAFDDTPWFKKKKAERTNVQSEASQHTGRLDEPDPGNEEIEEGDFIFNGYKDILVECKNKEIVDAVIPQGVVHIRRNAFAECEKLRSVILPDSVRTIGRQAFASCNNLTSLMIPDGVRSIGDEAFVYCSKLTVTIPPSVKIIEEDAFGGVLAIKSDNEDFPTDSFGVLFDREKKILLCVPLTLSGHYTIPSGVKSIGNGAFCRCQKLTKVTIPEGVTRTGYYAFCNCINLKDVILPESFVYADYEAFSGTPCEYELLRKYPYFFPLE